MADDDAPDPAHQPQLQADASIAEAVQRREGDWVAVGGIVSAKRMVATGGGERIARLTLTDFNASVDILVFAKTLTQIDPGIDDVVVVGGRVTRATRGVMIVAQLVERFDWQDLAEPPSA